MASPGGKVAEGGDGRKVEESAPGEPDMFEVPESKQTPAVVRTGALSAEWDGSVEVVNGYRILKHLGRGAYAEVRLCEAPDGTRCVRTTPVGHGTTAPLHHHNVHAHGRV